MQSHKQQAKMTWSAGVLRRLLTGAPLLLGFFLFLSCCQSGDGHPNFRSPKNAAAVFSYCATKDTLMELVCAGYGRMRSWYGSSSIPAADSFEHVIDNAADSLKKKLTGPSDTGAISLMVRRVYENWGVVFNPAANTAEAVLPQTVLARKQGTCLGISLLFLLIAERAGLPLHGVLLPGHFFMRFDNGPCRRNVEPNAGGIQRSEDYYRQLYAVASDSWYSLRNLSKQEAAAVFYYMLGNSCRENNKTSEAQSCYKTALDLFPNYPEALGNLALVYAAAGSYDSARSFLDRAAALSPRDPQVWRNAGSLELQRGRAGEALTLFARGRALAPDDQALLYGSAVSYYEMNRFDSARGLVERLHAQGDTTNRTRSLERLLPKKNGSR